MVLIDPKSAGQGGDFEPGVHLVEVIDAEHRHGQSGDPLFGIKLEGTGLSGTKSTLCRDVIMLAGKGLGIGVAKLKALGFFADGEPEDVQAHQLVGRRCWVRVDWQRYKDRNGENRKGLKPVGSFDPFDCGYYPEGEPPEDVSDPLFPETEQPTPSQPVDDSSVPF